MLIDKPLISFTMVTNLGINVYFLLAVFTQFFFRWLFILHVLTLFYPRMIQYDGYIKSTLLLILLTLAKIFHAH